jgi:hypothetical protein
MKGWERTVDLLSRGTYVSAGFVDRMLDPDVRNAAEAWNFARGEFITPEDRLTFSDVLKRHAPAWSARNPVKNFVLGLGMDIALDPLTYLGGGAVKGAFSLTSGALRGAAKGLRLGGRLAKGDDVWNIGNAVASGMTAGMADEAAEAGVKFSRYAIEHQETKRAYDALSQSRRATERSIGREYEKRLARIQKRQAEDLFAFEKAKARGLEQGTTKALQDVGQYGKAEEARRVGGVLEDFPSVPERVVGGPKPRPGGQTQQIKKMRQAAKERKLFESVPEQAIQPEAVPKTRTQVTGTPSQIVRPGKAIRLPKSPQLPLREAGEALPATSVSATRKLVEPTAELSEETVKYVNDALAPLKEGYLKELSLITERHGMQHRALKEWKQKALNDGLNILNEAQQIGRARSTTARMTMKWLPPAAKRGADVLSTPAIREGIEAVGKAGFVKAIGAEYKALDKSLGIMSGARRLEKWISQSDSWFGRKWDTAKELFNRDYKIPAWIVEGRNRLYGQMLRAVPRVQDDLADIFGTLSKADSEKLGQRMYETYWETEKVRKAQGGLKVGQAAEIRAKHMNDLTDAEKVVVAKVYSNFDRIGMLDQQAGMIDELLDNYVPGLYENIEKNFLGMSKKQRANIPNAYTPGEAKALRSLDEIEAAGLKPVYDLQTIFTARAMAHHNAQAQHTFNRMLELAYPGLKMVKGAGPDEPLRYAVSIREADILKEFKGARKIDKGVNKGAWQAKDGSLLTPSHRVYNEISFIGDGLYGPEAFGQANKLLQGYDRMLGFFRGAATVLKPAFAIKQILSNNAQVYLEFGAKGMKIWDPRTMVDTAMMMARHEGKFGITNVYGQAITGKQLYREVLEHGMMTNTVMDPSLGKNWMPNNIKQMQRLVNRERMIRKVSANNEVGEGITRTFLGTLKYTDLPGHVEDWFRISTFTNARRIGMSADQAAKHTQNALFNYLHGLSDFEARWARRVVPFYSYQRFALPLIGRIAATHPGRVANLGKVTDAAFKSFNKIHKGETLNESERRAIPGWLLDQPMAFAEFNERMQATFHTFNSFSPLDLITNYQEFGGMEEDGEWDIDGGIFRAIQKGALSQMTPVLKLPLEVIMNKNFFTGKQLAYGATNWKEVLEKKTPKGQYDEDVFFANMVGATAAGMAKMVAPQGSVLEEAPTAWALIAKFMGQEVAEGREDIIEDFLEIVTGWERGVDPKTGEETVYMSPWKIHTATSFFPFLKDVFRQSDEELTPMQKTLSLFTGAQTVKLDLAEEQQRRMKEADRIMNKKIRNVQDLGMTQRNNQYHESLNELRELQDSLGEYYQGLTEHGVRRALKPPYAGHQVVPVSPFTPDDADDHLTDYTEFNEDLD